MNIERMKELVRVLREVDAMQMRQEQITFNLLDWFEVDDQTVLEGVAEDFATADKEGTTLIHIPHKCGTTACAVGYAGLDPWFRANGLKTNLDGWITYDVNEGYGPKQTKSWTAVKKFFDISNGTAEDLFHFYSYTDGKDDVIPATVGMVAERVIKLIQEVEPEYKG